MKLIDHCLQERIKNRLVWWKINQEERLWENLKLDDGNKDKKTKGTTKCVIKIILKFNDCKNCLLKMK